MSIRETYTLAHSAQCKLRMQSHRPDRNLRFLVGHAMHYESLRLRIIQIEEGIEQPDHAEQVRFKGAGNQVASDSLPSESPVVKKRARSPPPPARPAEEQDDDDDDALAAGDTYDNDDDGEDGESLGLTRFPSGSARPPALEPSDEDESSSDEDDEPPPVAMPTAEPDPAVLKLLTQQKGDEQLAKLYRSIKGCPCQSQHAAAPDIEQIWELPASDADKAGRIRTTVAEIRA